MDATTATLYVNIESDAAMVVHTGGYACHTFPARTRTGESVCTPQSRRDKREVSMPLFDRLRGQSSQSGSETVICPTCREENPIGTIICQSCRGALPPKVADTAPISGAVTVSVTATAATAEEAAAAVKATAGAAPTPVTVLCPTCSEPAPVTAIICPSCRGVLPPRPEQHARSASASSSSDGQT